MIKIVIEIINNKIGYKFEDKDVTLSEVALVNLKLDEAKDFLKEFEFEDDFEIREGYDEEE